jgi:tRNA threonylcarbamoyladenosine biosynthesis protein TsaB
VRILALETSGTGGSVAVLEGERLLAETDLPSGSRSAQTLAPRMREMLAQAGWESQDVQLVAVTQGPGSFTGLRIGATTAKTFAYAVGAEILGVNTLQVIAAQSPDKCDDVWTLLDAHRGQLFVGRYAPQAGQLPAEVEAAGVEGIEEWLARYSLETWLGGPGVARVAARLPGGAKILDAKRSAPSAATVGRVACRLHQRGQRQDVWSFTPRYFRPSAAEEKHP